jgi:3-deoxy-D-manno-octulosonic-acid transferase
MNLFFYNFVFSLFLPFIAGRIFFKSLRDSDYRKHFSNRLGIYNNKDNLKEVVWFHAVSLGEVISSQKIVKKILKENNVILSVTTPTGLREANKIFGEDVKVVYAPWDFQWFVSNFFRTYEPKSLILFETEIWPNIISVASNRKIPIILSNGRMSESSFQRYKKFNFFSKQIFRKITYAFVQSAAHKKRFIMLGIDSYKISNVGSVKFDIEINTHPEINKDDNKIILAASTHKHEDELIINAYMKLIEEFKEIKLIIVPRHPDRSESISNLLDEYKLASSIYDYVPNEFTENEVTVIKATGLLNKLYSQSTIAFVGGSLFKEYGGHNIIEPASQGCPFIIGPFMKNFYDIVEEFSNYDACIQIQDEKELVNAFKALLNSDKLRHDMSERAAEVCLKNQGSLNEQCNTILKIIRGDKIEISNSNN